MGAVPPPGFGASLDASVDEIPNDKRYRSPVPTHDDCLSEGNEAHAKVNRMGKDSVGTGANERTGRVARVLADPPMGSEGEDGPPLQRNPQQQQRESDPFASRGGLRITEHGGRENDDQQAIQILEDVVPVPRLDRKNNR